jgi:hypothetical protein
MTVRKVKLSDTQAKVIRTATHITVNGREAQRIGIVRGANVNTFHKLHSLGLIDAAHEYAHLTADGVGAWATLSADSATRTVWISDGEPTPEQRGPATVVATTVDGETFEYAHIPNGDPQRVELFRKEAAESFSGVKVLATPLVSTPEPTPVVNAPQTPAQATAWVMVDTLTNVIVEENTDRPDFRGDAARVLKITRTPDVYGPSTGRILARTGTWVQEYYPDVFDLKIVSTIPASAAGCWLDGAQGWHNTYRVVDMAVSHGFTVPEEWREDLEIFRSGLNVEADIDELSDMATEYLQALAPEGYGFVWDACELTLTAATDELPGTIDRLAMNGHTMTYDVTGVDETGRYTVSQWNARHSDNCRCTGEMLPDF